MRTSLFTLSSAKSAAWLLGLLLAVLSLCPQAVHATHIRAGDIQSRVDSITRNPNHIYFKMTLYCDPTNRELQRTSDFLFGDGTRINGVLRAQDITINTQVHIYTYFFDHIFPGPGVYTVSFIGENRVANVLNVRNGTSVSQNFYINTEITIDPILGLNHSPVLRAPAIDQGAIGQVFLHNPAAYDADGDSLVFTKLYSQQVAGYNSQTDQTTTVVRPSTLTSFVYPDDNSIAGSARQVPFEGIPVGNPVNRGNTSAATVYQQDPVTGQIVWNAPVQAGVYNVAMLIEEWRRYPKGSGIPPRRIGRLIRDMQIIVQNTTNIRPQITVPSDLCVQAGQPVTLAVSATDGQGPNSPPSALTLFAYSGILPPATFVQSGTGTSVTGTFRWTPDCSNISNQPYTVLFKVQDGPLTSTNTLIDEKPVRITVVGPPPQNLRAQTFNTSAVLTWDRYQCTNASNILIFRREGCYPYTPGPCDTGLPASAGYTQVGSVGPGVTTFTDDGGGNGLSRGVSYSYRIYAVFPLPAGGASIVSNEACLQFAGRSALLTNVDINTTSATTGQVVVKWTRPRTDNGGYDFPQPYGYRLSRAEGATGTFTQIAEIRNSLNDTTFVDNNRNTEGVQYRYQLVFFRTNTVNGAPAEAADAAATASSVRTSLVADGLGNRITVNFAYQTPWDNSRRPARIFRATSTAGPFTQIGTATPGATSGTYTDADPTLQRNQTYCYYVQTEGQYATPVNSAGALIYGSLLNKSQVTCAVLRPTPCTPVLSLRIINCDSLAALPRYPADNQTYQNSLSWTVGNTPAGCAANAVYYRIFRATSTAGPFVLLDSTNQLSYLNQQLAQQNYCYQVQAVTATGERSALSNIVCQSECVFFILPNIFVPGSNAVANRVFRPKTTSPITRTHIQIFNRWGRKVYESDQDPYINWTGGGVAGESTSSGLVADGIYYYLAEVTFADANRTQRVYKGWVEIVR